MVINTFKKFIKFFIAFYIFGLISGIDLIANGQSEEFSRFFKLEKRIFLNENDQTVFAFVSGLDIDSKGDLWIIDFSSSKVLKYSQSGGELEVIAIKGVGPNDVNMPESIFITPDDRIYVANIFKRVTIFDINGKGLNAFISTDGHIPTSSIAVNSKGYIILGGPKKRIDEKTGAVTGEMLHMYSPKGKYIKSFYKRSEKLETLNLSQYRSAYSCIDKDDNIYAVQPVEFQVSTFDKDGNFKRALGQKNKYYKEPTYLSDKIRQDDKKLREFEKTFTYVRGVFVLNDKVLVDSKIYSGSKNLMNWHYLDVYQLESGKLLYGGIQSNMPLYRIKNGNLYFSKNIETKEGDEQKVIEVYRMRFDEK